MKWQDIAARVLVAALLALAGALAERVQPGALPLPADVAPALALAHVPPALK